MNLSEYTNYDGLGLAELVRKEEVTASELAELAFSGVQDVNPQINAVIEVYQERVEKADELFVPEAPFCGVPFFLKDFGAAEAGKPQEMGSRLSQGYVAETDAYLTLRFKDAGVIILGRTTTPELGLAATTESILTGATKNPWDLDRIAGGSSGGSAAAVAAGIVPVAHASDGGGSIRSPAACCGLVGLKPSRGRVTMGPDWDEFLFGLAQEFVVSRTVRDTATMLDNLRRFKNAGGKVALGTDFDGYDCEFDLGMPMTEMILMQKAGMTPMQIIVAGTKHGAHVCNLDHELGTIEKGKIADIIVVEGNPLNDIQLLQNVRIVIHNGEIIRRERF